jgi:hypothetical protein
MPAAAGRRATRPRRNYAAKGFTAAKMRVVGRDGFSIANCVRRVKAARRGLGPDVELMIDAHGSLENANGLFLCAKLASAIAAGCTVVMKPSELSSLQTQVWLECVHAANLPKGLCNVVIGRGDVVGAELVRNPDVAKISFTGSAAVGRSIMRDGAATMKRVTLELGGKSPISCSTTPISKRLSRLPW